MKFDRGRKSDVYFYIHEWVTPAARHLIIQECVRALRLGETNVFLRRIYSRVSARCMLTSYKTRGGHKNGH